MRRVQSCNQKTWWQAPIMAGAVVLPFFLKVPGWWFLSNYDMLIWKMLKYVGIWWFFGVFFVESKYDILCWYAFGLNLFFFQSCFRKWERFQVGASPIGGGCQMSLWRKRSSGRFETEQQKHTGSIWFSCYWWTLSHMLNTIQDDVQLSFTLRNAGKLLSKRI